MCFSITKKKYGKQKKVPLILWELNMLSLILCLHCFLEHKTIGQKIPLIKVLMITNKCYWLLMVKI